jgi:glycosyltransferase involved in cell wall biosynthesis
MKHTPNSTEQGLHKSLWWQYACLGNEARTKGCDILLNTDAGTVSRFSPAVTMSRNMLPFEEGEMQRYGFGKRRLRLELLKIVQAASLRRSAGAIFLTKYASKKIQCYSGPLRNVAHIPHGIGDNFKTNIPERCKKWSQQTTVRCIYVSPIAPYKHQGNVIRAIGHLQRQGYKVTLKLLGGGDASDINQIVRQIQCSDLQFESVDLAGTAKHSDIPAQLDNSDLFIFASSCENMPNALMEGMAKGLPIACSDRGPMPEVLKDGGIYFDPEDYFSIAKSIQLLIDEPELRRSKSQRAKLIAMEYSWARCGNETWAFLAKTLSQSRSKD